MKAFTYFTDLEYQLGVLTVELNRNIHQLFLQPKISEVIIDIKDNKNLFT